MEFKELDDISIYTKKSNLTKEKLEEIKGTISYFENKIKNSGVEQNNLKIRKIKAIALKTILLLAVSGSVMVFVVTNAGWPFKRDAFGKKEQIKKGINSNNQITIEENYENLYYENEIDVYGDWSLNENDQYERTVDHYSFSLDRLNEEQIINFVNSGASNIELLGVKPKRAIEVKEELENEGNKSGKFVQAYYIYNSDNVKYEYETDSNNAIVTALEFLWIIYTGAWVGRLISGTNEKYKTEENRLNSQIQEYEREIAIRKRELK